MNKSFTLIEILVVIVVIGIISSFIIVGLSSVSDKANIAKGQAFSNSLRNSLLMNLVSEWKLDEGTGSTTLDSWGSNTGTLGTSTIGDAAEPTRIADCVSGKCLSFDGTDDYIEIANNSMLQPRDAITISTWVKIIAYPAAQASIIDKGNSAIPYIDYRLRIRLDGKIAWELGDGTSDSGTNFLSNSSLAINKWYNVVVNYNKVSRNIYINGVFDNTNSSFVSQIGARSNNLQIGRHMGGNYCFSGILDEIQFYNSSVSTNQIQERYFVGINKLFKNNEIALNEFNERITSLKLNLSQLGF
jgi:prepilin-type N-terminal cleavage/methylation domain-containing protein